MRVLKRVIASAVSQVIEGDSFAFAGEVWEPKRLLDDLVILICGYHIGIGEDVDIVRREEVEVSYKVLDRFAMVEGRGGGWWWGPQEEEKHKRGPQRRGGDREVPHFPRELFALRVALLCVQIKRENE